MSQVGDTWGPRRISQRPWHTSQLKSQTGVYDASGNRIGSAKYVGDGKLFAAAPDMLAALEFITEQVANPANAHHTLDAYVRGAGIATARAAIAKARGA